MNYTDLIYFDNVLDCFMFSWQSKIIPLCADNFCIALIEADMIAQHQYERPYQEKKMEVTKIKFLPLLAAIIGFILIFTADWRIGIGALLLAVSAVMSAMEDNDADE